MGVFHRPDICPDRVATLNLVPCETFPLAKVDFAQSRTKVEFCSEMCCNRLRSLLGPPKVARINPSDYRLRQHSHQTSELITASRIELGIRMAAEPTSHVGFS